MRKTKLLLDAVVAAGITDVNFFALDLCEDSLSQALEQLQGARCSHLSPAATLDPYVTVCTTTCGCVISQKQCKATWQRSGTVWLLASPSQCIW